ncbi:MAG: serine/threonine-protein kinase [Myxococcota bacterium]|nr:serine/threonine-protein kinase [Myxococcota bacterium]
MVSTAATLLPQPGSTVGPYRIVEEIGRGGMAVVYAAVRSGEGGLNRLVALKFLAPRLLEEPRFVQMFLDECRIAARLHHPNIVQVFEVDRHGELPYLVMELLQGITLSELMRAGPLSPGHAARVLAACARGLHAAHEALGPDGLPLDIVHRDFCPQNVHIAFDGHVRVVDFGIAAARGKIAQTHSGELKGHLSHMAPEQIETPKSVDRRADLWALGVTAFEVLTQRHLFRDQNQPSTIWNVLHRRIPSLDDVRPDVPPALADLVARCLSRDPADRPATGEAIASELETIASAAPDGDTAGLVAILETRFAEELRAAKELASRAAEAPARSAEVSAPRGWSRWWLTVPIAAGIAGIAAAIFMASEPPEIPAAPETLAATSPIPADADADAGAPEAELPEADAGAPPVDASTEEAAPPDPPRARRPARARRPTRARRAAEAPSEFLASPYGD